MNVDNSNKGRLVNGSPPFFSFRFIMPFEHSRRVLSPDEGIGMQLLLQLLLRIIQVERQIPLG